MVTLSNVCKHYGTQDVLTGVSCKITKGQKIGLVGANGAGKTTLIRLLLGAEEPSSGRISREPGVRLGYVPQNPAYDDDRGILGMLLSDHRAAETRLREEEDVLARAAPPDMDKALDRYARAREAYDAAGGDEPPLRAKRIVGSLGLGECTGRPVRSLSGGEKNVLSLAQALLADPTVLVLDEPGNHLDYMGLAWLESYLAAFPGAVLIVSHSRYLLDRVVDTVYELENGTVTEYAGNYSTYRMTKLRNLVAQQADYVANQKRLAQLEALVKRLSLDGSDRTKARRHQLEREKKQAVQKPELQRRTMSLDAYLPASKADIGLDIRSYRRAFDDTVLFDDANLKISCGDRIALVGPNGCGKTTLLRDIVAHGSWDSDTIRVGPSLKVGYCAQQQEVFDPSHTILEAFLDLGLNNRDEVGKALSPYLFAWDDLDKHLSGLSGGEINRLQFARVMLLRSDFLILDEPTNHMDIVSKEVIEDSLSSFKGTILLVSHDRYLLEKIVTMIVEVRDGKLQRFFGGFSQFWASAVSMSRAAGGKVQTRARERRKMDEGQAQRRTTGGRAERQNSSARRLEERIQTLEERQKGLETDISNAFSVGDHRQGRRLSNELSEVLREIERLYEEWDRVS